MTGFGRFLEKKPYVPPSWASHLTPIPSHTYSIGRFPTPIHKWELPNLPKGTEVWIKREDLTGILLSGNKARKLEFLMADAISQGADCVITMGGLQSNHCRTTAAAAKYLKLDCYLICFVEDLNKNPGLVGNLLIDRLVGAHIKLVPGQAYFETGPEALFEMLRGKLVAEGKKPYIIPIGASNTLGTWGYIEGIREIEQQIQEENQKIQFDDIVVACGSGGTVAGLAIGSKLSGLNTKIKAFSVTSSPECLFDTIQAKINELQAGFDLHELVTIQDVQGLGYGFSTTEELKFVKEIATSTGVLLDSVYYGKAAFGMMNDMKANPSKWEGRKVLFIHTGGIYELYDKIDQMLPLAGDWSELEIDKSVSPTA
ncbi:putative D-cysteine desulfhydrase [Dioscorea sansibarensis]